ncbi:hypothetical protein Sviol_29440 [Streptomyces violascens]|uniref:NAD-glutamate dehydrogenase n=1 Tax=Streptomyces violascens TaxID=67381 RepID=A0ABQ3QMM9_9ACTN|nr:hypothetical protein Sviol_29440 [Streptomyces violascens]
MRRGARRRAAPPLRPRVPRGYKADHSPRAAVADLVHLEQLTHGRKDFALSLYEPVGAAPGERRFKIYRIGEQVSLSAVLPVLQRLGVEVTDERPYELRCADRTHAWIYDFGLRMPKKINGNGDYLADDARERFQEAFAATWTGAAENDGFNSLVLRAGLNWRQAMVLRAYAKYLRQAGSTFSQDYMEDTLRDNVHTTRLLVSLFEARLSPDRQRAGTELIDGLLEELDGALDQVASLDEDRILRSFLTVIKATLRTNFFQSASDGSGKKGQETADGSPHAYVSMKFDPQAIPDLPAPRPAFEIWVYSPRVEGVHLRFGKVARGGLRWSDRREDFRTEILGLVKAQMVKNTVIVPVGAKGGFVAKQLPDPSVDRDAWLAEGIASYKTFISALLDITDNLVAGEVVPPADVVRHDEDDTYLVVAADKGTATFSDIANDVAISYNFWLGDAFASGGSAGYDHKGMGITARGAWESVQAALPRARPRHPDRGLHGRRRRRHVGRRVRQRHAALRAHPPGRGLRPPAHLHRPEAGRGRLLRRAPPPVRPCRAPAGPTTTRNCSRRAAASTPAPPSRSR